MSETAAVQIPPVPRTLKRTASTASLPTPPRTRHRRKNGSKKPLNDRTDTDSDLSHNESECELSSLGESGEGTSLFKKRRTEVSKDTTEDEDAFWLGSMGGDAITRDQKAVPMSVKSVASSLHSPPQSPAKPAAVNVRRSQRTLNKKQVSISTVQKVAATQVVASPPAPAAPPLSPPPSKHKRPVTPVKKVFPTLDFTAAPIFNPVVTPSPPSTPKRIRRPVRDSPENPFLDTPLDPDFVLDFNNRDVSPTPSKTFKEPPTMFYVYRGKRQEVPNPFYNYAKGRPRSPLPGADLPIEDWGYSPDFRAFPRVLFPVPKKRSGALNKKQQQSQKGQATPLPATPKAKKSRVVSAARRSLSPAGDDDDDEHVDLGPIKPLKLGVPSMLRPQKTVGKPVETKVVKNPGKVRPPSSSASATAKGREAKPASVDKGKAKAKMTDPFESKKKTRSQCKA